MRIYNTQPNITPSFNANIKFADDKTRKAAIKSTIKHPEKKVKDTFFKFMKYDNNSTYKVLYNRNPEPFFLLVRNNGEMINIGEDFITGLKRLMRCKR